MLRNKVWFSLVIGLVLIMVSSATFAMPSFRYPIAELSFFDAETFTYVYTVNVSSVDSFAFGHFRVYVMVPNSGITAGWLTAGPIVNRVIAPDWRTTIGQWEVGPEAKDYVDWQASSVAEISKGSNWSGEFRLVAPNTQPVEGWLFTSDGPGSEHLLVGTVPGQSVSVPESSSLVCGILGLAFSGCGNAMRSKWRMNKQ